MEDLNLYIERAHGYILKAACKEELWSTYTVKLLSCYKNNEDDFYELIWSESRLCTF